MSDIPSQPPQQQQQQQPQFHLATWSRLVQLPIVASAVNTVSGLYDSTKKRLSPTLVHGVETTVIAASQPLLSVANYGSPYIAPLDNFGTKGLDKLERAFPLIKEPPEQIYHTSKEFYERSVRTRVHAALDISESVIDRVLPDITSTTAAAAGEAEKTNGAGSSVHKEGAVEEKAKKADISAAAAAPSIPRRVVTLGYHVGSRVQKHAVYQWSNLRRKEEEIANMKSTTYAIGYARDFLDRQKTRLRERIGVDGAANGIELLRDSIRHAEVSKTAQQSISHFSMETQRIISSTMDRLAAQRNHVPPLFQESLSNLRGFLSARLAMYTQSLSNYYTSHSTEHQRDLLNSFLRETTQRLQSAQSYLLAYVVQYSRSYGPIHSRKASPARTNGIANGAHVEMQEMVKPATNGGSPDVTTSGSEDDGIIYITGNAEEEDEASSPVGVNGHGKEDAASSAVSSAAADSEEAAGSPEKASATAALAEINGYYN